MSFKLKGRDRLRFAMKQMPEKARAEIRPVVHSVGAEATGMIRRLAPVATESTPEKPAGALRDSVEGHPGSQVPELYYSRRKRAAKNKSGDPDLAYVISAGGEKAPYALHVETGTKAHEAGGKFEGAEIPDIPAQPFFYPGFRAGAKSGVARINRAARKVLRSWSG